MVGSVAYRIFVWRLYHEPRFAEPYSVRDPRSAPDEEDWADRFAGALPAE
jgi:hypothetical protein